MPPVFCPQCGHQNVLAAVFCTSCGALLPGGADQTITLAKIDPHQDAPGPADDTVVRLDELPAGVASLVVRSGSQAGSTFALDGAVTRLGRHPDSDIMLDDITVSRRHAEIVRDGGRYEIVDDGSLNGTYVNGERVDRVELRQGDEVQIGKFRLVFLTGPKPAAASDSA